MAKAKTRLTALPSRASDRLKSRDIEKLVNLNLSLGYLIKEAHASYTNALRHKLKPYDITLAQWYFLRELWMHEGLTQRELSRRMKIAEPTTTTALRLMEEKGLIKRRQNKNDLRNLHIHLTSKGRSLRDQVLANVLTVNEEASRGMSSASIKIFQESIWHMINNLSDDDGHEAS